jgi:ribosomal protein S18 acetylase RimI-like enzyme
MVIRTFKREDEQQIIDLWQECNLTTAWNNPQRDIERKMQDSPELFFVGETDHTIVASCMAGYDGHRGWIYYLAVKPDHQRQGVASKIMNHAEEALSEIGCPKIDLMVRKTNHNVISFYHKIGYNDDPVVVLSKRLEVDEPLWPN